ncbi:MAG: glycosyltransferase family 2 protein [Candidatus Yanofskybacteria bacterium]|nr:glycosyltransferase family 2 protein [Candidatus Yanofskybacteria bacterium]
MNLSIIIIHYKSPELLKLCLGSIRDHVLNQIPELETLVVDSEAQTETGEILKEKFSWAKYLPLTKNVGYAAGVNHGLKNAKGEHVLILNPDIIVTPGSVQKMLECLDQNQDIGLCGPKLLNFNGQTQNSKFRFYRPLTIVYRRTFLGKMPFAKKHLADFNIKNLNPGSKSFPDWLMGSALMTTQAALKKVGLMDERFKLYFEDVDWAKRFWENGYKVAYLPSAAMLHYHIRQSRAGFDFLDVFLRRETRWHIESAIKYFFKHGLKYRSGENLLNYDKKAQ